MEEDFTALGIGELTLEQYVDLTLSVLEANTLNFELVSRQQISTGQDLPAEVLVFTFQGGLFKASRLIYLHENRLGFNATYVTGLARYETLEALIDYSFDTFGIWKPGAEVDDNLVELGGSESKLAK